MGRKHYGKRRNCLLQANSPFPTVFSKDLHCRQVKTRACSVIILGRTIGANLSPMAQENMTYGPKWPLKILDGAIFTLTAPKKKTVIFQFLIQACCKELSVVNIYTCTLFSKLDSKVKCLSFNLMHEIIDKVSYQLADAYLAKI